MDSCDNQAVMDRFDWWQIAGNFPRCNGISMLEISEEGGIGEMPLTPDKYNGNNEVHGGAYYMLADTVAGVSAWAWGLRHLGEGTSCVTLSTSFDFLRPARDCQQIRCKATYRKMGRSIAVVDVSVYDEKEVELCCGTFNFYFIDLKSYQKNK